MSETTESISPNTWRVEFAFYFAANYPQLSDSVLAEVLVDFSERLPQGSVWARAYRLTNTVSNEDGVAFDVADSFSTPVNALAVVLEAAENAFRSSSIPIAGHGVTDIRIERVATRTDSGLGVSE